MTAPERVALWCVPVGSIVQGPGERGTLYEVVRHSAMASTVRQVMRSGAQVDFLAHGTERVRFMARSGRAPFRWSGATRVEVVEVPQ